MRPLGSMVLALMFAALPLAGIAPARAYARCWVEVAEPEIQEMTYKGEFIGHKAVATVGTECDEDVTVQNATAKLEQYVSGQWVTTAANRDPCTNCRYWGNYTEARCHGRPTLRTQGELTYIDYEDGVQGNEDATSFAVTAICELPAIDPPGLWPG